jgi:hypothetical protein
MTLSDNNGPFEAFGKCVRAALPRLDMLKLQRARVVAQSTDLLSLDVVPDNRDFPPMSGVRLRHGLPGVTVKVAPGTSVVVGFPDGDPTQDFCALWEGGETVEQLVLAAAQIFLGAQAGAEPTLMGTTYRTAEDAYLAAIATAVGAALSALGLTAAATALSTATTAWQEAAPTFVANRVMVSRG